MPHASPDSHPPSPHDPAVVERVLSEVLRQTGVDFRGYARASLHRRLARMLELEGLPALDQLEARLHEDPLLAGRLARGVCVGTTSLFRDPEAFKTLREQVAPHLKTYPWLRVWNAGCSTGAEVYSAAILLEETGLLSRTRIYATDLNEESLAVAKAGLLPAAERAGYARDYLAAGGTRSLEDYLEPHEGERCVFSPRLSERVVFSPHSLVAGGRFNEFHLVLCRNVLIYFNHALQQRVERLLHASTRPLGYLMLGGRETLTPEGRRCWRPVSADHRIYQRKD